MSSHTVPSLLSSAGHRTIPALQRDYRQEFIHACKNVSSINSMRFRGKKKKKEKRLHLLCRDLLRLNAVKILHAWKMLQSKAVGRLFRDGVFRVTMSCCSTCPREHRSWSFRVSLAGVQRGRRKKYMGKEEVGWLSYRDRVGTCM